MKNSLFFLGVFILWTTISCSQKEDQSSESFLIERLKASQNAYEKEEWNLVTTFLHPKLFNYVTKEDFIAAMKKSLEHDDSYEVLYRKNVIDSISPIMQYKSDKYALVYQKATSYMVFNNLSDFSNESSIHEIMSNVCKTLQEKLTDNYVDCFVKSNGVEFTIMEKSCAIYLSKKGKWFFLSKGDDINEMRNKIIPKEVREKLNY